MGSFRPFRLLAIGIAITVAVCKLLHTIGVFPSLWHMNKTNLLRWVPFVHFG